MSKKATKAIVPKLRFPEFKNMEAWDEKTLGDITFKVDKKNKEGKCYPVYSINNIVGFVPQSEQFDGVDSNKRGYDISLYKVIEKNTFAYNPARINVGSIGYSGDLNNIIVSSLYVCFKTTQDIDDKFLQYFIETPAFTEAVKDNAEGGIRSYLFYENFSRIKIALPRKEEQKKIADCLSSINELIIAQAQKVETLNAHKKGLMQQFFPAEGETVPKLRFPEFRDGEEWNIKTLEQLTTRIGDGIHGTPKYDDNGAYFFINGNNLVNGKISISEFTKRVNENEAKANSRELSDRTILLSINGTIGNLARYNNEPIMLGKSAAYINLKEDVEIGFVYNALMAPPIYNYFLNELTGSTIKNLSLKTIRETTISIPSAHEQQKIADCLSSIDALITAQIRKGEALNAHKKGLLQQLFPAMDEVGA